MTKTLFVTALVLGGQALHAHSDKLRLALDANGSDTAVIAAGWPVVLRVTVSRPRNVPGSDAFDPALSVWDAFWPAGTRQNWRISPLRPAQQKTTLNAAHDLVTLTWGIAPQQTAGLNGAFHVRLTVGKKQTTVEVQLNNARAGDAQTESDRRFLFAQYDLYQGDAAGALMLMQEEMKAHPGDVSAVSMAADALVELNRKPEAFAMLGDALESIRRERSQTDREPPAALMRQYNDQGMACGGPSNPKGVSFIGIDSHASKIWTPEAIRTVVAHELAHAVNAYHHGEGDSDVTWTMSNDQIFENGKPITAFFEDGRPMEDVIWFLFNRTGRRSVQLWKGVTRAQHSGAEDCIMRYDVAQTYMVGSRISVRYYFVRPEVMGTSMCAKPDGTCVNAPGRQPRVRYYAAANGRGDCIGQILATDAVNPPKRPMSRSNK